MNKGDNSMEQARQGTVSSATVSDQLGLSAVSPQAAQAGSTLGQDGSNCESRSSSDHVDKVVRTITTVRQAIDPRSNDRLVKDNASRTEGHHASDSSATHSNDRSPKEIETVATISTSGLGTGANKKRTYNFIQRTPRTETGPSEKRKRFMNQGELTEDHFKDIQCCKRKQCFSKVNLSHVVTTNKKVMKMSNAERRDALQALLTDMNVFTFDGRPVCAEFLVKAFRFSRDLQSTVKGTERAVLQRREVINYTAPPEVNGRDSVIVFLRRIADQTGNVMPDSTEVHLPFYDKKQVYEIYCEQFRLLHNEPPPVLAYFYATWKENADHIKIRKVTKFTKCATCESFKDAFEKAGKNVKRVGELQVARKAHYDHVACERQAYLMNQENAKLNPSDYMSIAIDGADQSAFGLPHFVTITKDTKGHSLKVKLIGVLEHGMEKRVALYTMTEDHETGANHVIECIHRYLNIRNANHGLPKVLCVQMDNCTRENKNRYTLGYLESLVLWGVFQEVFVSFLPLGHTHIDVDQLFSRTATRLHRHPAVTLTDLHNELRMSYTPAPMVNHASKIANFSGLCDATKVVWDGKDGRVSQYRYFRFYKTKGTFDEATPGETVRTTCEVKRNSKDNWEKLRPDQSTNDFGGFLLGTPILKKTPATSHRCPPDKDEVVKRLVSEEVRIGDAQRMKELRDLVGTVYQNRTSKFHWDLTNTIETRRNRSEEVGVLQQKNDTTAVGQYVYKVNQFVAVRHSEPTEKVPFWLGRISKVRITAGVITVLRVHWFEPSAGQDVYNSRYKQTNKTPHTKRFTVWASEIPVESVMVTFDGLTSRNQISVETCKKIQNAVSDRVQ